MSKLDKLDAELSAPQSTLREIVRMVSRADIDEAVSSDIPLESKRSQLQGLVALLDGKERQPVLNHAKDALAKVESEIEEPVIPQITS